MPKKSIGMPWRKQGEYVYPAPVQGKGKMLQIGGLHVVEKTDAQPINLLCSPEEAAILAPLVGKKVRATTVYEVVDSNGYVVKVWLLKKDAKKLVKSGKATPAKDD